MKSSKHLTPALLAIGLLTTLFVLILNRLTHNFFIQLIPLFLMPVLLLLLTGKLLKQKYKPFKGMLILFLTLFLTYAAILLVFTIWPLAGMGTADMGFEDAALLLLRYAGISVGIALLLGAIVFWGGNTGIPIPGNTPAYAPGKGRGLTTASVLFSRFIHFFSYHRKTHTRPVAINNANTGSAMTEINS